MKLSPAEFSGDIGVARATITPPVGIYSRTWGSAAHDVAEGVHQPLLATALVLHHTASAFELVLISLDALVFWPLAGRRIRRALEDQLQLKPEQLIMHPSHSHSTPFLTARHLERPGGELIEPYLESIAGVCAQLVMDARKRMAPATLTWSYGRCGLAYNRDATDPASGRDICGLNLLAEADDTLLVGRVCEDSGRIAATIVNYACHPVSLGGGNRLLSPDYIGAMRQLIETQTQGGPCLFLQGASGDLTPRRSYEADVGAAEQNGRELGYAALAALTSMFPPGQELRYAGIEESGTPLGKWALGAVAHVCGKLAAKTVTISLKVRPMPTRQELQERMAAATERYAIERLERALGRREQVGDGTHNDFSFTVWRVGDAFIVSTPAEPYSQFQLHLRRQFPDTAIAILNLSDGVSTYLPAPSAFNRDVYQARIALYDPDSLQRVTEAACAAIEELRR
ncbi:MAG TPA: neutral/alkaline non-lysosomal ceramidase N-terminal domain-containing protein [Steroidobacteraceae bacterium]